MVKLRNSTIAKFVIGGLVSGCILGCFVGDSAKRDNTVIEPRVSEDTMAYKWCNAFVRKDFTACDTYSVYKLGSFYASDYAYSSDMSALVYQTLLSELVDCVKSIEEISYGKGSHTLTISYNPMMPIDEKSFKFNKSGLETICKSYILGDYSYEDYNNELKNFVKTVVTSNIGVSEEVRTFDIKLEELQISDDTFISGVERVELEGVDQFYKHLLADTGAIDALAVIEDCLTKEMKFFTDKYSKKG